MSLECKSALVSVLQRLAKAGGRRLRTDPLYADPALGLELDLGEDLASNLWSAFRQLHLELVPQYADRILLWNAFLQELLIEVDENSHRYATSNQALAELVDEFGERWKQPLKEYEVAFVIDNLSLETDQISLNGIEMFAPSETGLAQKGIPKDLIEQFGKREGTFCIGMAFVQASDIRIAFEALRERAAETLNLLQAAGLEGLTSKPHAHELVQWFLSGHYLVRSINQGLPSNWELQGFHRPYGPTVRPLGKEISKGIAKLRLEELEKRPHEIRDRIKRAMYWIARSSTHESDDHRLVDLCTALEILLLPDGKSERNKGTLIALRYNLLGGTLQPGAVKWMYDRRNEVVHGDPLPVVDQHDIWQLRDVCLSTARLTLSFSTENPTLPTQEGLVSSIETPEQLERFVKFCENGTYHGSQIRFLLKEARKRLRNPNS